VEGFDSGVKGLTALVSVHGIHMLVFLKGTVSSDLLTECLCVFVCVHRIFSRKKKVFFDTMKACSGRSSMALIFNLGVRWGSATSPVAYRGGLGGSNPPPHPKFGSFEKAEPISQFCGK
jgi:hypothetical protein